ncbi:MAG: FAD-dependent oxidoreductase [Lentisphaeria bacterium]
MRDSYDVIVIGSGLGGMTAARRLAAAGHRVLLAEQHGMLGGLATFFRRRGHLFDVALHGFPVGMAKSFRKYWGKDFSDRVTQVASIRFDNPQFSLDTTFDTADFTRHLTGRFRLAPETVAAFFQALAGMNYYDNQGETTREFLNRLFPGRTDVWRFLMEPIAYANGSTLDEPAVSYGIVFGNFMSKGVYTFTGGTDLMLEMMERELRNAGVDVEKHCLAERILIEGGRVRGVQLNGRTVACRAAVSNGSLHRTVFELAGRESVSPEFAAGLDRVRLSTSSCQVYIGIKPGEKLPFLGDLLFTSVHPEFDSAALCAPRITSRTYSIYYPSIRPGTDRHTIVASMNARMEDWAGLDDAAYHAAKRAMIEDTLTALERYLPEVRRLVDYTEAATPCTFARYTRHLNGATFGTKFNGLPFSMDLHKQAGGLFHTGSVGIIMSGWLGAANYGVITASEVDKYLARK